MTRFVFARSCFLYSYLKGPCNASLTISCSLTISLPLFSIYALSVTTLQLFGVQYPLSFCAGMVLVQLGLHFSLKRHTDNSAGSFISLLFLSFKSLLLTIKPLSSVVSRPKLLLPQCPTRHHLELTMTICLTFKMTNAAFKGDWII